MALVWQKGMCSNVLIGPDWCDEIDDKQVVGV